MPIPGPAAMPGSGPTAPSCPAAPSAAGWCPGTRPPWPMPIAPKGGTGKPAGPTARATAAGGSPPAASCAAMAAWWACGINPTALGMLGMLGMLKKAPVPGPGMTAPGWWPSRPIGPSPMGPATLGEACTPLPLPLPLPEELLLPTLLNCWRACAGWSVESGRVQQGEEAAGRFRLCKRAAAGDGEPAAARHRAADSGGHWRAAAHLLHLLPRHQLQQAVAVAKGLAKLLPVPALHTGRRHPGAGRGVLRRLEGLRAGPRTAPAGRRPVGAHGTAGAGGRHALHTRWACRWAPLQAGQRSAARLTRARLASSGVSNSTNATLECRFSLWGCT